MSFSKLKKGAPKLVVLFFVLASISCERASNRHSKKPVVVVNGIELTAEEFGKQLANRLKNHNALMAKQDETVQRVKDDIVNEFITAVIMKSFAEESGLGSFDSQVEEQVQKVRGSYPDDLSFRNALAQENMSLEDWKASLRRSLYEKAVFESLSKSITDPTDREIEEFYKDNKKSFEVPAQIRLRQIVLEKEEDAKRALSRIRQGGNNLEKLAREFSVAPEGKIGGDTGWVQKGALEVFDSAFNMAVGSRSGIVKSPYGYHIFEVLGKRQASVRSLKEARPQIIANLRAEKERSVFRNWLAERIRSATIQKDQELISAIKVHTEH